MDIENEKNSNPLITQNTNMFGIFQDENTLNS